MRTVYLDNNATTRVAPEVVEAMMPYFTDYYGNPSSAHEFGGQVAAKVNEARAQVAQLLHAADVDIIFTSCGTESDNTAIRAALVSQPDKRHIVTTRVEHPAVLNVCQHLEKKEGYEVTYLGVDNQGRLDLNQLDEAVREDTAVVSIMWANNETGVIFPIEEIAQRVKAKGAIFHTDAVQAVGKIDIDLSKVPVDMLSLSGHKLHAPKGIGVLYVRKGTKFAPFMLGGHQERGRRAGTENVPYIIGLGKAAELARERMEEENTRVRALRDRLQAGLVAAVPRVLVSGGETERLPNTLSISFEMIEGESILLKMSALGIAASSGSACTSGSLEPSHVLRAMGVPFTAAHGTIRFSLSIYNTEEDIDYVLEKLPPIIQQLRDMSPFWEPSMGVCQTADSTE